MKKITLLLLLACTSMAVNAQGKKAVAKDATLKGTVSFEKKLYENATPDVGATVLIHKSDTKRDTPQDSLSNYKGIVMLNHLYESTKDNNYLEQLKTRSAETKEKFDAIAKATFRYYYMMKTDPQTITAVVDASGNYNVQLKPGRYEVVFVSGNVKAANLLESRGIIDNYFIEVKAGENKEQNHKFKKLYK